MIILWKNMKYVPTIPLISYKHDIIMLCVKYGYCKSCLSNVSGNTPAKRD